MENKLKSLFDYQRFARNEKLTRLIEETEIRQGMEELSEDELTMAAGGQRLALAEREKEPEKFR